MALLDQSVSDVKCCNCGGMKTPFDMFLPITQRGSFFQDSFFSNFHQHFDAAVKDVLSRWPDPEVKMLDDMSQRQPDALNRYRRLRSVDLKEENQAVAITSDDTSRKVVLDVHDFIGGDVKVKVVGDKDLVVEGRVDRRGEGNSSVSCHTFRRRFSMPRLTDVNAITSAMSSDGVLTITTPKLEEDTQSKGTVIPIQMEGNPSVASGNASAGGAKGEADRYKCDHCCHQEDSQKGKAPQQEGTSVPITNYRPQENQAPQNAAQASAGPKVIPVQTEVSQHQGSAATQDPVFSQQVTGSQQINKAGPRQGAATAGDSGMQNGQETSLAPCSMAHGSPSGGAGEDGSSGARGKVMLPPQEEEENVYYKSALKPRKDGKFPIKISGTIINSNVI